VGPEISAAFIGVGGTGLGAILGALAAYPLGKRQGRDQVRYQQRADTAIELRRRVLEIVDELEVLNDAYESEEYGTRADRTARSRSVYDRVVGLHTYFEQSEPWLERKTRETVKPVIMKLWDFASPLRGDERIDEVTSALFFATAMDSYQKGKRDLDDRVNALSQEVARVVDTK